MTDHQRPQVAKAEISDCHENTDNVDRCQVGESDRLLAAIKFISGSR